MTLRLDACAGFKKTRIKKKMNKEAVRAYNKAYHEANREKARAYNKIYREANKEKLKAYIKAYRKANKEKLNAQSKAYHQTNKKVVRLRNKAWRQRNPEIYRKHNRTHHALKHTTQAEPINEKIVYLRDGWKCQICKKRVDKEFKWPDPMFASLDHIIPLSKGGTHTYNNVQLVHLKCNLRKYNNIVPHGEQMRLF